MNNTFLSLSNLGKNGPVRWIGGTLVILFFWFIVGSLFAIPFLLLSGVLFTGDISLGDPLWTFIATNVTFLGIWLGLVLVVRLIHQRPFRSLITPAFSISWSRLGEGFIVWLILIAIFQVIEFVIYPARLQFTFDPARWLLFLPLVLIFTPLQTTAEELLFRGYWLQGTGRLTQNVPALIVVNGILFGLPHMLNPEVVSHPDSTLLLFLGYFGTGAILALFTLRDNRLELALGAHAANNLFAALVVNYADSALTTPSIITDTTLDAVFGLVTVVLSAAVFYFIVFGIGRQKRA